MFHCSFHSSRCLFGIQHRRGLQLTGASRRIGGPLATVVDQPAVGPVIQEYANGRDVSSERRAVERGVSLRNGLDLTSAPSPIKISQTAAWPCMAAE